MYRRMWKFAFIWSLVFITLMFLSPLTFEAQAQEGSVSAPGGSIQAPGSAPAQGSPGLPSNLQNIQNILQNAAPAQEAPAAQPGQISAPQEETPAEAPTQAPVEVGEQMTPEAFSALSDAQLDQLFLNTPASQVMRMLPRFGFDFFRQAPSTYAPVMAVPVGPDYVVGPGDEIRISIWGMIEDQWSVTVDRDGNLSLPGAGVIGAAGMTFSQLQQAIKKEYSRYYTNFDLNVTMGRLRTILVYVVGNARRPGAYTVSSLATLVNALVASGGPSQTGSMRNIQVRRNGKVVTNFDMYDMLLKGDTSNDIRLMPGDVIFIGEVGQLVGIVGNVKRPGLYELKERVRLGDLIDMAGGLTGQSFKGRVQIMRVEDRRYLTLVEGDLDTLGKDFMQRFAVQDGDIVRLFPVARSTSTVRITGPVATPGEYAIEPGITKLSEVINRAGGLSYMASNQAEITRVTVTQQGPVTQHLLVNLEKAMKGDPKNDIPLEMNDYIFVRAVPEWDLYATVTISGEVKYPGVYTIKKGETLSDLIERAGGYTDRAFLPGAIFTRESVRESQRRSIDEMVQRLERELYTASAAGTASSLTSEDAKLVEMETQQKRRMLDMLRQTRATGRVVIRLEDPPTLLKKTPYDLLLEEGDRLHIPREAQTINVAGNVLNPSSFIFEPYSTYNDYIEKAGGYGRNADRSRVYLLKADGSAVRVGHLKKPPYIERGDTIIVPEKIQVASDLRRTSDIVDIVYKTAISAAVAIDAFDD
ncbi:SLBB domain-containing protein [Acetomicrobium sp. UBA5826]|uniref:SLBB domain-containing protein n=1 Tax=Acetomicrobium sp. UBA5826 TaxID=1946039 RepID=UPI00257C5EA9|nr:SLBB domain-containing protein [Acetomicrobium sp. UBA5826]